MKQLRLAVPRGGDAHDIFSRRPLRILVADGHAAAADSLALLLTVLGHVVRVARTGPAALEAFHAFRPDLLLSDIVLPELDGISERVLPVYASRLAGRSFAVRCRRSGQE